MSLRNKIIRLAHSNPSLREHLLPLLSKTSGQHQVQVGDILNASWGYNQTTVNFYQVISLVGKRTVTLREVEKKTVRSETSGDYVIPKPNSFKSSKIYKKRLGSDGSSVQIDSSIYAYKWGGKPQFQTGIGYGH